MTTQLALFDYDTLDTETRIVVQQRTTEIKALMKRAATDIIEIGQKLKEVQHILGYGPFDGWLKTEFEWSRRTAYNFIGVADQFGCANFAQLNIAASALYLLAAPSTPDSARQEALERAADGEPITHQTARDIVGNHRNPPIPFVPDEDDEPLSPYEEQIATQYTNGHTAESLPPTDDDRQNIQRRQQIAVITGSSESNEWYTPAYVIELAREVMGTIDLDPASCETANAIVQADHFYTTDDDSYGKPWHGCIWLNPPYGKEDGERETNAVRWARKLATEYHAGRTESAILLVKAALGYNWFEDLWRDWPTCLLRERVSFIRPDGTNDGQAKHATALLYFGTDVARFQSIFRPFGRIILPESCDEVD